MKVGFLALKVAAKLRVSGVSVVDFFVLVG